MTLPLYLSRSLIWSLTVQNLLSVSPVGIEQHRMMLWQLCWKLISLASIDTRTISPCPGNMQIANVYVAVSKLAFDLLNEPYLCQGKFNKFQSFNWVYFVIIFGDSSWLAGNKEMPIACQISTTNQVKL